ncbi:hypothetical protein AB1Y20_019467 [Prymnesium parvum]|uniref:Uncharacterized protein n=1 Tax=Prymnesium parvum TaxID=97485 RepID=A0AB34JUJ3_PRYPA
MMVKMVTVEMVAEMPAMEVQLPVAMTEQVVATLGKDVMATGKLGWVVGGVVAMAVEAATATVATMVEKVIVAMVAEMPVMEVRLPVALTEQVVAAIAGEGLAKGKQGWVVRGVVSMAVEAATATVATMVEKVNVAMVAEMPAMEVKLPVALMEQVVAAMAGEGMAKGKQGWVVGGVVAM